MQPYDRIRRFLNRVRSRWRTLRTLQAVVRSGLAVSAVLGVALVASRLAGRSPGALAIIGVSAVVFAAIALVWGLTPLRNVPGDAQVARFVEERAPALDDRLASAVDVVTSHRPAPPVTLVEPMLADAARRVDDVDVDDIVPGEHVWNAAFKAIAVGLVLAGLTFVSRGPARQAFDAAMLALFPGRVTLQVTPGNARVQSGTPLVIEARLVGNRAPVVAQLEMGDNDRWQSTEMKTGADKFLLAVPSVTSPFKYRVIAGGVTSPTYSVTVLHAPRVTRIDIDYRYPAALGLKPRTEIDSGDIYAPAGTDVRLHIHADRPTSSGQIALADGQPIALARDGQAELSASLKVVADNSYRIAIAGVDGLTSAGDTEYFIRTLEDRPPEVRILAPAADRSVTKLEEVDIEAQAEDDYGIDRLELVYAVRGGADRVVPLAIPHGGTKVNGRRTLYLEDLAVQPGDFVSYYVRTRDIARARQGAEARSDIYFLEVKPFEQEFALAQSQSNTGAGSRDSIDDLVIAQKEVIVATWKLDRRARAAKGAKSEQDIRSVARAEGELKSRVEHTSNTFRESTMRDPRRPGRGGQAGAPKAGESLVEEDDMAAAGVAMGKAVTSLDALKTGEALSPEMEALNHLLKAQADVKRRQIARQQSGGAGADNNRNYDVSTLFDKELQRTQQTNYETRSTTEQSNDSKSDLLDKIKKLAERQDELLKRQQELARQRETMTEEELKRELEKLTREQNELRQGAEELARQQGDASSNGTGSGQRMREVSDAMRGAATDLRRQQPGQATVKGNRALAGLRELERQLQASTPDGRRRATGEMRLEAQQLAGREREVASAASKLGQGETAKDAARKLAGEQDQLAERVRKLQENLKAAAGDGKSRDATVQTTADAARELERQRLAERMQKSADAMRSGAAQGQSAAQQDLARALDKVADTLAADGGARDPESQKLSEQLAKVQGLRDRLGAPSPDLAGQLQQTRELLEQLRRDDPSAVQAGAGFTFEGRGMTLSAPGTEAFKQDFARWEELRIQATRALDAAESALSKKLQAKQAHDRLAAGVEDKAPAAYQQQVDRYFKALAEKKK